MDFDPSKENIQPLRGGRNASQLEVALQAEHNAELEQTIIQQRQNFEAQIAATEDSDDPLSSWYDYIQWVEQTYPKHGHQGNLSALIFECLQKYEKDSRYKHDRRLCKLIIKYVDMLENPQEMYKALHDYGMCVGIADFYKAWAYYYEAAGDYQTAHHIFEHAKTNNAQPFDEIVAAHRNLVTAAGQHMINGTRDENQLESKRRALTALVSFKSGRVGSVRHAAGFGPGALDGVTASGSSSNAPISIFEDEDQGAGAVGLQGSGSTSIFAVNPEEKIKENVLKPGTWTTCPLPKRHLPSKPKRNFTVHEDVDGLYLNPDYPKESIEDFSDWIVPLTIMEPADDTKVAMYPKSEVYSQVMKEFSLEEIKARSYSVNKLDSYSLMDYSTIKVVEQSPNIEQNQSIFKQIFEDRQSEQHASFQSDEACALKIWTDSPSTPYNAKKPASFQIFEEEEEEDEQVGGGGGVVASSSAMKTPFKDLNAEELAETGSRGGMDVAAAAPVDSAKRLQVFDDNSLSNSPSGGGLNDQGNLSCNTQMFLNLSKMKVSTPNVKSVPLSPFVNQEEALKTRKQLFFESEKQEQEKLEKLSTILEETKSGYGSSSGSTGGNTKSSLMSNHTKPNMTTISEEHTKNLHQNLMANAELRSSLFGNDLGIIPSTHSTKQSNSSLINVSPTPLNQIPSDPFKQSVVDDLLRRVNFPGPHRTNFHYLQHIPKLSIRKEPSLIGGDRYMIEKQLGRGTFGVVFRCVETTSGRSLALKWQKPPNKWEFYICRELQERLANHDLRNRFMDVKIAYFCEGVSVLLSDFMPYGSLLDVANVVKQKSGRAMKESLCIHFALEMLRIVQAMHQVKVIHADIKPDNFLINLLPNDTVALQLIDFGCSIDMSLFPAGATFTRKVTTENFICCEMIDGRPWSYHTDLFCVAATAHVLLFEKYIAMRTVDGMWAISHKLPRYARVDLWNMFFSTLLNQQDGPSNCGPLLAMLEESLHHKFDDYHTDLRYLLNILNNR